MFPVRAVFVSHTRSLGWIVVATATSIMAFGASLTVSVRADRVMRGGFCVEFHPDTLPINALEAALVFASSQ